MNRQDLIEEVKRLRDSGIEYDALIGEGFTSLPEYSYLDIEFENNKLKKGKNKEKWHQFVRFALSDPKEHQYMYDSLLRLLLKYRKSYSDYFKIKNERGTFYFPDRLADLNRLLILYREYFQIYKNAVNRIHFDHPVENISETQIRGKINWDKTLKNSTTKVPTKFETTQWVREFETDENILLVLVAIWLNAESKRLLETEFTEPLESHELSILSQIVENTQKIIYTFPFQNVVNSSRRYATLDIKDSRINALESNVRLRIRRGIIRNKEYQNLLVWIEKFRQLNIRMISGSSTDFPLDSIENLDTIYEVWLFFEMIDHFNEKGILLKLELDNDPNYFDIDYSGYKIRFYYEIEFKGEADHAWAVTSRPDFTVMTDDKILAILDAKNYNKASSLKTEASNKMLAYITNLSAGYGALLFPNFDFKEFTYSGELDAPKYHSNLKLAHYRMEPKNTDATIKTRKESLDRIFSEIVKRLELKIRVN